MTKIPSTLALAALSGLVAGSLVACGGEEEAPAPEVKPEVKAEKEAPAEAEQPAAIPEHACKGMNECKGQGGCGVEGANSCHGANDCKGAGGCCTMSEKSECPPHDAPAEAAPEGEGNPEGPTKKADVDAAAGVAGPAGTKKLDGPDKAGKAGAKK
ncbi:MAG: hypothetical protein GY884_03100 [Proteobacteria bacterium]|nr:hypothetical protein [Pseudomonadota bacterium]